MVHFLSDLWRSNWKLTFKKKFILKYDHFLAISFAPFEPFDTYATSKEQRKEAICDK